MLQAKNISSILGDLEEQGLDKDDINKVNMGMRIMQACNEPALAIKQYAQLHAQVLQDNKGYINESDIQAITSLPCYNGFSADEAEKYTKIGEENISRLGVLKLNGGLGTGMGLDQAKTLLPIKDGVPFLDIIVRQMLHNNTTLILMNSERTDADTAQFLSNPEYKDLKVTSFVQGKFPRIDQATMTPISEKDYKSEAFSPGGHGAIYTTLQTETIKEDGLSKSIIDYLISNNIDWLFVSNGDNLGATADSMLLGYAIENNLPFMMEVAERVDTDKKGGHLVRMNNGRLTLRESAQCNPADIQPDGSHFGENIKLHKYFNTNSIWINLRELSVLLDQNSGVLPLSLIRNPKETDAKICGKKDAVYQLETAMGSAISLFDKAEAVVVPRTRFAPVKNNNELFVRWSNIYELHDGHSLIINPKFNGEQPDIKLQDKYFKIYSDFAARVDKDNPVDLLNCVSLTVTGNVYFGQGVTIIGRVEIVGNDDPNGWPIANQTLGKRGLKTVVKPGNIMEYFVKDGNEYRPATEEEIKNADPKPIYFTM